MKYAINLSAVLPVRKEASEASEMVTQLLFGEFCEVFESEGAFVKIRNLLDDYTGWVDEKMLTEVSASEFDDLKDMPVFRVLVPLAEVFCLSNKTIYRLSAGSLLPGYDANTSKFGFNDKIFQIHPSFVTYLPQGETNVDGIIPSAMQFLNTPYLWGGKNIMGMDCSGFVQIVFSLNGVSLPRDASQQIEMGTEVNFDEVLPGDLMFFNKNEGKVSHVGIFLGDGRIVHASGSVRIDNVDKTGIFRKENLTYTHHLLAVKRVN